MTKPFDNIYNGKRVLITGHTGFKGSWLSLWLHRLGATVIGYALDIPTKPSLFEICDLENKTISTIGDIRDLKMLRGVFDTYKPEIVFHLAAQSLVRPSYKNPVETFETNVMGTVHLLEACRHTPSVRAIVNVTSDKCYENREQMLAYKESDPMGGCGDPYSSSKGCSELINTAYMRSYFNPEEYERHGIALASARSGNVIGGGDWSEDRLIPDCIKAFLQKKVVTIRYPDAVRPWQHVLEPLYGYLLLAQQLYQKKIEFIGGWNFGPNDEDARPVSWLVEKIAVLWGRGAAWAIDKNSHPHEARYLKLDCKKARSELRWFSALDIHKALVETMDWYKRYYNSEDMASFSVSQIMDYEKISEKSRDEMQILR